MSGSEPLLITAESLRRRDEWRLYPTSAVAWEESADENEGIGFDNLDPSAMARAFIVAHAGWPEIIAWYREHLGALGWQGREVSPHAWWKWTHQARNREQISVLDRSSVTLPSFVPVLEPGATLYELLFTARGEGLETGSPDA